LPFTRSFAAAWCCVSEWEAAPPDRATPEPEEPREGDDGTLLARFERFMGEDENA
jgi:hypothetical protein